MKSRTWNAGNENGGHKNAAGHMNSLHFSIIIVIINIILFYSKKRYT